ncbi:FecCD family ABC transporter permease [Planctomicrobium piriforme]|uniref:Iron complex transport system permease protein n=1 Tax=Planctomicrobium piriforme TaxID=1576369 RepID=A0A1I3CK74_9PLAN|nr:iron ABC transporter permease [Planctomicrobium piriforme]SFH74878.1 iron complex transport system permease protein [Planctomicrobium piriforme]
MDGRTESPVISQVVPRAPLHVYQRRTRQRFWLLAGVLLLTACSLVVDVMTGPAALTPRQIFTTILLPDAVSRSSQTIVWSFRLPTAFLAVAVGAALGLAGGQMQTILNNPLASPYTLGVSAAASFGAALVLACGAGQFGFASTLAIPAGAFAVALACSLALYFVNRLPGSTSETLLVGGVALHFLFSSGVALLQYLSSNDVLQAIVFWTFGSLQGATWTKVTLLATAFCLTLVLTFPQVWQLTALQLGNEYALSLGVDVDRLKLRTMLLISVLTATAVCFTGTIGFVGLVAPHLARRLVGEDQRFLLLMSAGCGALLVSVAAVLCKTLVPGTVFPIGIVTAAIGAPFFAILAFRSPR